MKLVTGNGSQAFIAATQSTVAAIRQHARESTRPLELLGIIRRL